MNTTKSISKPKGKKRPKRGIAREKDRTIMIPRGEYKGWKVHRAPSYYIKFIAENWSESTQENRILVEECDKEWQFRESNNCHITKGQAEK